MVGAVFVLSALAFGALGSVSVFLKPLTAEFGWTRAETAFGYTLMSFAAASFGLLWGALADRIGTRWFGVAGAIAMAGCLWLLSGQSALWQFYLGYFLFGAFGNALVGPPLFANVGFWFKRRPGLALGITAAGGAFGQGVVPWLAGFAITAYGWQGAYVLLAAVYLAIALPVGLLIRECPARLQPSTTSDSEEFPLATWEVVAWISAAIIFCCNCMAVPIVHLVPLLTDAGSSLADATNVLMLLMFCGVAGRVVGGQLGDTIGPLRAYLLMSLGQTLTVLWFPYLTQSAGLYLLAAAFGFAYSGVMSSILVCVRHMVPAHSAGRAMSITQFFGWLGMGMGGFMGGWLYDSQGSYQWSYGFAAAAGVINLLILLSFTLRLRGSGKATPAFQAG